ncbi:hypothetical protein AAMO2058_001571900 [Amorphochlora amoebiformis]
MSHYNTLGVARVALAATNTNSSRVVPIALVSTDLDVVGPCNNIVLDASLSTNGAGSPLIYNWTYVAGPGVGETLSSQQGNARITIPSTNVSVGIHTFGLQVLNWVGYLSDLVTVNVSKVKSLGPSLIIPSTSSRIQMDPTLNYVLRTQLQPPCGAGQYVSSRINWIQVFESDSGVQDAMRKGVVSPGEVSSEKVQLPFTNSTQLSFWNYTLTPGSTYAFRADFSSSNQNGSISGSSQYVVILDALIPPVKANIYGGSTRVVSTSASVTLNASGSTDMAFPTSVLSYHWNVTGITLSSSAASQATLDLSTLSLTAGQTYQATVTVSGTSVGGNSRKGSATVTIVFINDPAAPSIFIESKKGQIRPNVFSSLASSSNYIVVNDGDALALEANVLDSDTLQDSITWTCTSLASFDLANLNTAGDLTAGPTGRLLAFKAGLLQGGLTYSFRASVSGSYSSVSVLVNRPPRLGSCAMSPAVGRSLETEFELSCLGWSDSEVPLEFKFQERARNTTSELDHARWIDLCKYRTKSTYHTLLFATPGEQSSMVVVRGLVRDSLGAASISDHMGAKVNASLTRDPDSDEVLHDRTDKYNQGDTQRFSVLQRAIAASSSSSAQISSAIDWITQLVKLHISRGSFDIEDISHLPLELLQDVTSDKHYYSTSSKARVQQDLVQSSPFQGPLLDSRARSSALNALQSALASPFREPGQTEFSMGFLERCAHVLGNLIATLDAQTSNPPPGSVVTSAAKSESNKMVSVAKTIALLILNTLTSRENYATLTTPHLRFTVQVVPPSYTKGLSLGSAGSLSSQFSPTTNNEDDSVGVVVMETPHRLFPFMPHDDSWQSGTAAIWTWQLGSQLPATEVSYLASSSPTSVLYSLRIPHTSRDSALWNSTNGQAYLWDESIGAWVNGLQSTINDTAGPTESAFQVKLTSSGLFGVFGTNSRLSQGDRTLAESQIVTKKCDFAYVFVALTVAFLVALWGMSYLSRKSNGLEDFEDFWRDLNKTRMLRLAAPRSRFAWNLVADWGHRRRHPLWSIFYHPKGDFLTHTKRVLVLSGTVSTAGLVCALVLNAIDNESNGDQNVSIVAAIVAALICLVVSFPLPMIFRYLFNRDVPSFFVLKPVPMQMIAGGYDWQKKFGIVFGTMCSEVAGYCREETYPTKKHEESQRNSIDNTSVLASVTGSLNTQNNKGINVGSHLSRTSTLKANPLEVTRDCKVDIKPVHIGNMLPCDGDVISDIDVKASEWNLDRHVDLIEETDNLKSRCCGLGADPHEINNEEWTKQDFLGAAVIIVIVCTCLGVVVSYPPLSGRLCIVWIAACLIWFVLDVICHWLEIAVVEMALLKSFKASPSDNVKKEWHAVKTNKVVPLPPSSSFHDEKQGYTETSMQSEHRNGLTIVDSMRDNRNGSARKLNVTMSTNANMEVGVTLVGLQVSYLDDSTRADGFKAQGVQPGCILTHINAIRVANQREANYHLYQAHRSERKVTLAFEPGGKGSKFKEGKTDTFMIQDKVTTAKVVAIVEAMEEKMGVEEIYISPEKTGAGKIKINPGNENPKQQLPDDEDGKSSSEDSETSSSSSTDGDFSEIIMNPETMSKIVDIDRNLTSLTRVSKVDATIELAPEVVVEALITKPSTNTEKTQSVSEEKSSVDGNDVNILEQKSGTTSGQRSSRRRPRTRSGKNTVHVTYQAGEEFDFDVDGVDDLYVDSLEKKGKANALGVVRGMRLTHVNGLEVGAGLPADTIITGCRKAGKAVTLTFHLCDGDIWNDTSTSGGESIELIDMTETARERFNQELEEQSDSTSSQS